MKTYTLIHKEYGRTQKLVLYGLLGFSFLSTGYALFWFYEKLRNFAGSAIAQAALAIAFAFVLILVAVGFFLGHRIDRMIKEGRLPLHTTTSARWLDFLIRMWKYERKYTDLKEATDKEDAPDEIPPKPIPTLEEIKEYILVEERQSPPSKKHKKRRSGRPPAFPVHRWVPVALKWESRDPMRDEYSLGGVISEYLGVNPDGSPIMSEQVYRKTWRDLGLEEARRMIKSGEMTDPHLLKLFKKYYEKKAWEG